MDQSTIHANVNSTDSTLRVGAAIPPAKNGDTTIRPDTMPGDTGQAPAADFTLKGRLYRGVKCLSDNSGEAQVFLVEGDEGERVLKVYYPNFTLRKELMRIIMSFNLEMVVRVTDYGKTYVDGKKRDYELMEYLRGGTLSDYDLDGDFNQFRRIALQTAAALAYCHNNNIIHKDIKPGNFFFRDTRHREVVLGDFGISSIMSGDERLHRTTQARTPVYAAPEMYNDVIDGEVEITPAADYYSLGITLMTLWLGENPMSQNERVMMRRKNEGRLPRVDELPERVRMIVQGLTAVNPQSRWGYEQVERWFLGENVKVDISSPMLKYRSFIVDPEKNLVADNVHELIPLLMDNDRLAISYLYSGRIAGWLEQCGNVKLSSAVKDIVVNRYPVDQKAGLMASAYVMDSTFPYRDVRGNQCDDIHSVAISLLSYQEEYSLALRNPNDNLFLYVESHTKADVGRLRGYFAKDSGVEPRIAILRTVYEIDREIPFLARFPSSSLAEIVRSFGYEEVTDEDWLSLSDGRLLSWMYSHEDTMGCEALRIMTQGQKPTRSLGYKVLYNMDRDAAFDLREADTPHKVADILAAQLMAWQELSEQEFEEKIADYAAPDSRFQYFAKLRGWVEQLAIARSCFSMSSQENRQRLGAYDLRTAAYRFCVMLGGAPAYQLEDGTLLNSGADIDIERDRPRLISALRHGALSQWMSLSYHENPQGDFSLEYSYEHQLEAWVSAMGQIDPGQHYYKRYISAKEETARKYTEVRESFRQGKRRERHWRLTFYALCAVWLLFLGVLGLGDHTALMRNSTLAIVAPVGGVTALIVTVHAYFRGYGFLMACLWGGAGLLTSLVPVYILKYINGSMPAAFIPAVAVITVIYMLICHLTGVRGDSEGDSQLIAEVMEDDIKSTLLEPLYYTFKQKSFKFKGSKFGMLDDVTNQIRSISGESVLHYMLWCLMIGAVLIEFILFNPHLVNMKTPLANHTELKANSVINKLQNKGE